MPTSGADIETRVMIIVEMLERAVAEVRRLSAEYKNDDDDDTHRQTFPPPQERKP